MKYFNRTNYKKGVSLGLISGITWALDAIIVAIVLTTNIFIKNKRNALLAPFVIVCIKDFFSAILFSIFMARQHKFKDVIKSTFKGDVNIAILGYIIGGPIGLICYTYSMKYMCPAKVTNISAIYPAVATIFSYIFLKERLQPTSIIGIFLSFLGAFIITYKRGFVRSHRRLFVGLTLVFISVLCWSLESILCAYQMKKNSISAEKLINIRQIISFSFDMLIIIPLLNAQSLVWLAIGSKAGVLILVASLISTISYLCWYKSINLIGVSKATTLNVSYIMWVILFQGLFMGKQMKIKFIIGSLILMSGAILVVFQKDRV